MQLISNFNKEFRFFLLDSGFKDNTWGAYLADMQLISNFNKEFRFFLLCVIDIYSKYAWVVPLKDKKGVSIVNTFQKVLKESNKSQSQSKGQRKPKKYGLRKKVNFLKMVKR